MEKLETAKELLRWGQGDLSNEERVRWKRHVSAFLNGEYDATLSAVTDLARNQKLTA